MERLQIDDIQIEYEVRGHGEPVLLIHPNIADGLAQPLVSQPELAYKYRLIHYHLRGWVGSTRGQTTLTIERQAADAAALLRHLKISRAHIAGHSLGGLIALQLVLDAPDFVHSLALLEPALPPGPEGRAQFEKVAGPAREQYRTGNKRGFVLQFSDTVFGIGWQSIVERAVPGGVEQAVADADIFYDVWPTLYEWKFDSGRAATIKQPVLSVIGRQSQPFRQAHRRVLHSWFPQTEDLDLDATHLLQMQDPKGVARGLAEFFARHPMT